MHVQLNIHNLLLTDNNYNYNYNYKNNQNLTSPDLYINISSVNDIIVHGMY